MYVCVCQLRLAPALALCDARVRIPSASAAEKKPTSPPPVRSSQSGRKSAQTSPRRYDYVFHITVPIS